jgi:hypothetical protein
MFTNAHHIPQPSVTFHTTPTFLQQVVVSPHQTNKLEDCPLSAVCDCLFNIFTAAPISGGLLLHLLSEDAPCHGDKGPIQHGLYYAYISQLVNTPSQQLP